MILDEGSFVLIVAEVRSTGAFTGIYDLFRIEDGKIVEHWDTLQSISTAADWKNENGKFQASYGEKET